ncbi:hypothetical protein J3R83DRAFT_9027 [Lanmaoa asiatica]|nr:hypothetical protein J3R83DRAFT_9027 [Lanmaoa asiatica]
MIAVTLWLPETPRWLMQHDCTPDRGTAVLAKLCGISSDYPMAQHERAGILNTIVLGAKEKCSWSDLFKDHGIRGNKRFYSCSRHPVHATSDRHQHRHIVTYYAPTLFQQSLGMTQERSLFVGCFLQVWYISDLDGIQDSVSVLVLEAICVKLNTPRASVGAVFLVFTYEACFT